MRNASAPFQLKVERVSPTVDFLDVSLKLVETPSGHMTVSHEIFRKPTSCGVPLAGDSTHPPHVLKNWPIAQAARFRTLSSCALTFRRHVNDLLKQLQSVSIDPECEQTLLTMPFFRSTPSGRNVEPKGKTFWLVLPYHPVWHRAGFGAELNRNLEVFRHALCAIPGGAIFENAKIRISWSITTQPLYFRARCYNNA